MIVCVDMDSHRDHRCLSLLTEEALKMVILEKNDYMPILLKKFAYKGVLFGKDDFFYYPHRRTVNEEDMLPNPFLLWDERISYVVPDDCNTLFLENNLIYKAIRLHKSQGMWTNASQFINSDIVFWQRNVNNLALFSQIEVSSGEKQWLNDFKLVDMGDVNVSTFDYTDKCWRPEEKDKIKTITVRLKTSTKISEVVLYFNTPGGISISNIVINMYNIDNILIGSKSENYQNVKDYSVKKIELQMKQKCSFVIICFQGVKGNLGLGEIEILENLQEIPFKEFLYASKESKNSIIKRELLKIDHLKHNIRCLWYRKIRDNYCKRRLEYDRKHTTI